jgi:hypothetical protein
VRVMAGTGKVVLEACFLERPQVDGHQTKAAGDTFRRQEHQHFTGSSHLMWVRCTGGLGSASSLIAATGAAYKSRNGSELRTRAELSFSSIAAQKGAAGSLL